MIRTIITPKNQNISIHLPKNFIGKNVEVIAFTTDETLVKSTQNDEILTHFASQNSLAKDWLTPQEDQAWKDL